MYLDIQVFGFGDYHTRFCLQEGRRDRGIFGHRSLIETISSSLFRGCGFSLYNEIGFPCPFNQRKKCFGGRVICREGVGGMTVCFLLFKSNAGTLCGECAWVDCQSVINCQSVYIM